MRNLFKLILLLSISYTSNVFGQSQESVKSNLELLQGKWIDVEDEASFLTFEGNLLNDEIFIISDTCMNELDKENTLGKEIDKYISLKDSDMCWYIVELTTTNLVLSYVGRGNDLSYRRVNVE